MKIKLLVSVAGLDFALSPGDITDRFTSDIAQRMIDAGQAVPVAKKPVERAVRKPAKETR